MIAAAWIITIYMLFNAPKPKQDAKAKGNEQEAAEKVDGQDGEKDKQNADSQKEDDGNPPAGDSPDNKSGSKTEPGKSAEKQTSENKTANQDSANQDSANKKSPDKSAGDQNKNQDAGNTTENQDPNNPQPDEKPAPQKRTIPQKFISLGSLASDSPYRFLVTFDNKAGSIHRLELVHRHRKSNKLKYKDLEVRYGYLGHLDLLTIESTGCQVQTVGSKTPADIAGIQVGDILTKFNDEPIQSRNEFEAAIEKTKPGETVNLTVKRDATEITMSVELMRQPLEVIRPNIVPEQAQFAFERVNNRPSYSVSLFNPVGTTWDPIGQAHTDVWDSEVGEDYVKFYYPYKDEQEIKDAGADYQIIKTFKLVPIEEEDRDNIAAMNYHLDFDIEVKNLSNEAKSLAYRIDGPNGLPTEDWWFAIKIHGEWSAVFSAAGARDIVASTSAKSFHFVGGPKIYTNATKPNQKKPIYIIDPSNQSPTAHELKYLGVDSHYFVSALIPTDAERNIASRMAYSAYAMPQGIRFSNEGEEAINTQRKKEANWYRKLVPVNFKAYFQFENPNTEKPSEKYLIGPNESAKQSFVIYAGPKEPQLLSNYIIDDTVTYGWFAAFSWPLVKLLHLFHAIIGNFAIAIIILTVLVRLAMMRFSRKMVLNSQMMQLLAPEIRAISEKFKDDFQAKSRAQQELFKKYNYNPFSGCLVMLIQLPVFIGLYRGLSVDMALRDQPLIPGISWCSNLAGPDQLWRWADDLPKFMSFLTHETGWLGPYFNLLPIISVALMLVQQKLFTPPAADEQQAMMQKVMTFMMIFIGIIFFKVPAGLCIYFITSTLWAIMEKKVFPQPTLEPHLQKRLDELKELQAKEKAEGVPPGTYTNVTTTAGGNASRKHTERAKKKSQKNRKK